MMIKVLVVEDDTFVNSHLEKTLATAKMTNDLVDSISITLVTNFTDAKKEFRNINDYDLFFFDNNLQGRGYGEYLVRESVRKGKKEIYSTSTSSDAVKNMKKYGAIGSVEKTASPDFWEKIIDIALLKL